jgi:hypothetical protein
MLTPCDWASKQLPANRHIKKYFRFAVIRIVAQRY